MSNKPMKKKKLKLQDMEVDDITGKKRREQRKREKENAFSRDSDSYISFDSSGMENRLRIDSQSCLKNLSCSWTGDLKSHLLQPKRFQATLLPSDIDLMKLEFKLRGLLTKMPLSDAIEEFTWDGISLQLSFALGLMIMNFFAVFFTTICFKNAIENKIKAKEYAGVFGLGMLILFGSESLTAVMSNYIEFRLQKVGIVLDFGIRSLIQSKMLKKSFERDHSFDQKSLDLFVEKTSDFLKNYPKRFYMRYYRGFYYLGLIIFFLGIFNIIDSFIILSILIITLSLLGSTFGQAKERRIESYEKGKRKRIFFIKDVFRNLLYVKKRGWDGIFKKSISKMRFFENKRLKKLESIENYWECLNYILFFCSTLLVIMTTVKDFQKGRQQSIKDISGGIVGYISFVFYVLKTYCIVRDSQNFDRFEIETKEIIELIQEFFRGEDLEARREMELKGVDNSFKLNNSDAIKIKDCYLYWDAKGSSEYSRKMAQEREEELRQNRALLRQERKKQYNEKLERMRGFSNISIENRDYAYTLNTVIEGKDEMFDPDKNPFKESKPVEETIDHELKDIDLTIKKGNFCFVLGTPSSGKSSLLKALAGEMKIDVKSKPYFKIKGNLFYMGSEPWILNASFKENIILNKKFDQGKFEEAMKYSRLAKVMKENGDLLKINCGEASSLFSDPLFKLKVECARCIYSR